MMPYYSKDGIEIYHGDCATITATLPDASINLVVEDWPYFRVKGEWWDRQWDKADKFLEWIDGLCQERKRLLTPNGTLYAFASPQMCDDVKAVVKRHFNVINTVRWYNHASRSFRNGPEALRSYLQPWEAVIVAEQQEYAVSEAGAIGGLRALIFEPIRSYLASEWKRARLTHKDMNIAVGSALTGGGMASHYVGNTGQWSMPTAEHYESLRQYANKHGNHGGEYLRRDYEYLRKDYEDLRKDYEDLRRPFHAERCRYASDLWHYAPVKDFPGKHPTEKPIAMMEDIIKVSSRPDDLVADLFLGRGTTADAARRCGRRFVGGDIMEKWVKASAARISQGWLFHAGAGEALGQGGQEGGGMGVLAGQAQQAGG